MTDDSTTQAFGRTTLPADETIDSLLLPLLGPAYNMALRLTRDPVDAEDLLQEAAVRACQAFHQFQTGTNFRAWFYKILVNCFYGRARRDRRRGHSVSIDDTPELYLYARTAEAGIHDHDSNPAASFLSRLETEEIGRALEELPEEYRAVSTLYFVEDLSYEEIANILGVPLGTVRSRLHRGRKMLQRKLWRVASEHGLGSDARGEADR